MNVVDQLVVSLALDASAFKKGQGDMSLAINKTKVETETAAKEMQASGAKAAEFFSKIKIEALSLIGVLIGAKGAEDFVRNTTNSLSDLGRQSKLIGESSQGISAFAMAIERSGGSAESARSMLQNFAEAQAKFKMNGEGNFGPEMALIGGDLDTKPLDAMKLFMSYIEKMKDEVGGIQKISLIGKDIFGFDQGTINSMVQIGSLANMNKEIAHSYELGVPTEDQIKRATTFQNALIGLEQAVTSSARTLVSDMSPALTVVADKLADLTIKYPEAARAIEASIIGLGAIKPAMWILRALGLAPLATAVLAEEVLYNATRVGGLNDGEQQDIETRMRAASPVYGPVDIHDRSALLKPEATGNPDQQGSRQQAIEFYRSKGHSPVASAALADVIGFETGNYNASSFNPAGGGMGARGAFNWRGDRILDYVDQNKRMPDAGSFVENLEFSEWELKHKYRDVDAGLKDIETEKEGVEFLNKHYTKPAAPYGGAVPGANARPHPATPTAPDQTNIFSMPLFWSKPLAPPAPDPALSVLPGPRADPQPTSSNTSVTIGQLSVHTQATDAAGIAKDIKSELVMQANRGLS